MRAYNFLVFGPKFAKFLTPAMGGAVVDHLLFRFSFCRPIPELFALKVVSCQRSRRILDVFWPPKFCWDNPSKSCTHLITPASRHVAWWSFVRLFPLTAKL